MRPATPGSWRSLGFPQGVDRMPGGTVGSAGTAGAVGPVGEPGARRRTRRTVSPSAPSAPRSRGVRIGHALGITSPRRAALLAVIVCALALSVSVPLRNYLSQRSELAAVHERQEILADQVAELERRRALLEDPQYVEAQARERLRYVRPGETPYVVQLPPPATQPGVDRHQDDRTDAPWFAKLWESLVGG